MVKFPSEKLGGEHRHTGALRGRKAHLDQEHPFKYSTFPLFVSHSVEYSKVNREDPERFLMWRYR